MVEIERKYIVAPTLLRSLEQAATRKSTLQQAYLPTKDGLVCRVRIADNVAYMTIKSAGLAVRNEWEWKVPLEEARDLLNTLNPPSLFKVRYEIRVGSHVWDVDVLPVEDRGLMILAEVELDHLNQDFTLPTWIGAEVTGRSEFAMSNLLTMEDRQKAYDLAYGG